MKNSFKVSYITTLPLEGNAPRVTITGNMPQKYMVEFYEFLPEGMKLVSSGYCNVNQTILAKAKQWFTQWAIIVKNESGTKVFSDVFTLEREVIFIKIDAWALGDTIAWIPYVEEFRKEHLCKVICSTFHNELLIDAYPDIMFVKPNTVIENVYTQYYIGATNKDNPFYSPIKVDENPLQMVASSTLGLDYVERRPSLISKYRYIGSRMQDKYVTLSEYGSTPNKHWKAEDGWQKVVDLLITKGLKVLVISKEKTQLKNVIDLSGDISLDNRAVDIMHAEFHLGVSSGLSWLAWALGKHVVMVSDVTPSWHEFHTDNTRINANDLEVINYLPEGQTEPNIVIEKLEELVGSRYL
jgi:autotransporter strand-loop-strand O-heptosyltransferase